MSVTKSATSQAVSDWVRVFPRQVTETYTSSVTFMKQLTTIAVSTMSYVKAVFPEDSFTIEYFGGINLRILKKKCRDELAQFMSTSLTHAFEAFDKKYLQKLALCFYDGECCKENLVECYTFEYLYTSDGVTMNLSSKNRDGQEHLSKYMFDNVKERTMNLIRTCVVVMQTPYDLPPTFDISLRLYYNDDAPEGYQAPGFLSSPEPLDHLDGVELALGNASKLGVVTTPFHRLSAHSYIRMHSIHSSREAIPSQNPPVMTQIDEDDFNDMSGQARDSVAARIVCTCQFTDAEEEASLLLTCEYCGTQQHAACFGRRARADRHCCMPCFDADPTRVTDPRLANLDDGKRRECVCVLRRTLVWCSTKRFVSVAAIQAKFGLSFINAVKLLHLLQGDGVLDKCKAETDIKSPMKVSTEQLDIVMRKYFMDEQCDLADRLVAETLSQPSVHDPVATVLRPLEKINLHNAATMGKIIEPPANDSAEDPALKQYKEALLSHQPMEELPLSGNHNPVKDMDMIGKKTTKRKDSGKENTKTGVRTKKARTVRS